MKRGATTISGPEYFGYFKDRVRALIEGLPGLEPGQGYNFRSHERDYIDADMQVRYMQWSHVSHETNYIV